MTAPSNENKIHVTSTITVFSAPSKQTQSSNAKDELSSTASINALSTTLIPSSELLASKPRDCTLKREQNSCYEHDNGLMSSTIR